MYGSTHNRITTIIARKLRDFPEEYVYPLSKSSESPDITPDYEKQIYITPKGKIGERKKRVLHHGTPHRVIKGIF